MSKEEEALQAELKVESILKMKFMMVVKKKTKV